MQLKKHGIHKVIVIGCIANTCIEATVRYAVELGYEVTLIKDAIAAFRCEEMAQPLKSTLQITRKRLLQPTSSCSNCPAEPWRNAIMSV